MAQDQVQAGEIEITPEAVRAGAQILENHFDALPSFAEEIAIDVFMKMMREMPESLERGLMPAIQVPQSKL